MTNTSIVLIALTVAGGLVGCDSAPSEADAFFRTTGDEAAATTGDAAATTTGDAAATTTGDAAATTTGDASTTTTSAELDASELSSVDDLVSEVEDPQPDVTYDLVDHRTLPRFQWSNLSDSGTTEQGLEFTVELSNPFETALVADLELAYDLGSSKQHLQSFDGHEVRPGETSRIELGQLVTSEQLAAMAFSGSVVVIAHLERPDAESVADMPTTVSTQQLFFHPNGDGLQLLTEVAFYATGLAGDFTRTRGGRERLAKLEATLGHSTNLRIKGESK